MKPGNMMAKYIPEYSVQDTTVCTHAFLSLLHFLISSADVSDPSSVTSWLIRCAYYSTSLQKHITTRAMQNPLIFCPS